MVMGEVYKSLGSVTVIRKRDNHQGDVRGII